VTLVALPQAASKSTQATTADPATAGLFPNRRDLSLPFALNSVLNNRKNLGTIGILPKNNLISYSFQITCINLYLTHRPIELNARLPDAVIFILAPL
jgi:hypothetical protein